MCLLSLLCPQYSYYEGKVNVSYTKNTNTQRECLGEVRGPVEEVLPFCVSFCSSLPPGTLYSVPLEWCHPLVSGLAVRDWTLVEASKPVSTLSDFAVWRPQGAPCTLVLPPVDEAEFVSANLQWKARM